MTSRASSPASGLNRSDPRRPPQRQVGDEVGVIDRGRYRDGAIAQRHEVLGPAERPQRLIVGEKMRHRDGISRLPGLDELPDRSKYPLVCSPSEIFGLRRAGDAPIFAVADQDGAKQRLFGRGVVGHRRDRIGPQFRHVGWRLHLGLPSGERSLIAALILRVEGREACLLGYAMPV